MSAHPDCELPTTECRIVKSEHTIAPATPWTPVYDGADNLVGADPTTYVKEYSCATCSRAWQEQTVGETTTLVDLPSAAHPPRNIDVPYAQQEGGLLTCTMGNWAGEPTRYSYQWVRDGNTNVGTGPSMAFSSDFVGDTVTCVVSASNAHGTTAAPPSNPVTVGAPTTSKAGTAPPARTAAAQEYAPAREA
jgi:hypothetical protein